MALGSVPGIVPETRKVLTLHTQLHFLAMCVCVGGGGGGCCSEYIITQPNTYTHPQFVDHFFHFAVVFRRRITVKVVCL